MTNPNDSARVGGGWTEGPWEFLVADDDELLDVMLNDASLVPDRIAGVVFSRTDPGAHGLGVTIATMNARRSTIGSDIASARLIAAAPDLYEALAEIMKAEDEDGVGWAPAAAKARLALARARGDAA